MASSGVVNQSAVMAAMEELLEAEGWRVAFTCRPNRPHLGVVPIPTASEYGRQRYPDIVATRGLEVYLGEVEPMYSVQILNSIRVRLHDQCSALAKRETYESWASAVARRTGVALPGVFLPRCELIVVRGLEGEQVHDLGDVLDTSLRVVGWPAYEL